MKGTNKCKILKEIRQKIADENDIPLVTREYIAVMEGELTVSLKDGLHTITKEDVFRFESDQDHKYMNLAKTRLSFMTFFVAY